MQQSQNSVQVFIRLQPPSQTHLNKIDSNTLICAGKQYYFDYVFETSASQEQIFNKIGLKALSNSKKGYNSCIFLYGQTGSGKTYTMTGTNSDMGLIQRFISKLWVVLQQFDSFEVRISYYEIYNEQVNDLLCKAKKNIKVKESLNLGFYLQNLEQKKIQSQQDIFDSLEKGLKNRTTAQTRMNKESSRSHSIFTIMLNTRQKKDNEEAFSIKASKIHFVDLAGSQKQKSTLASGNRLKEASSINKSLTSLSIVIQKLSYKSVHVPYRDSVLTKILKDSLGGNSKTILIATLSSKQTAIMETISTLHFAVKTKKVKLAAKINQQYDGSAVNMRKMIKSLQQELKIMKSKQKICNNCLSFRKDYEEMQNRYINLQKQLQAYQRKYGINNGIQVIDNCSEYDMATIEQVNEQTDSRVESKLIKNQQLKIQELKIQLASTQSEISLLKNEIRTLCDEKTLRQNYELDNFKPLLIKFAENLNKLRITECQKLIQLSQFYKIKLLKETIVNLEASAIRRNQIYQQQIQILKQKFIQIQKQTIAHNSQSYSIAQSLGNYSCNFQQKEKIQNKILAKQQLTALKRLSKELKQEKERLQIQNMEMEKQIDDMKATFSQQSTIIEEKHEVIKFWEGKYNQIYQKYEKISQDLLQSNKVSEIYRIKNSQSEKHFSRVQKQIAIHQQKINKHIQKKQKQVEQLQNQLIAQKQKTKKQLEKICQFEKNIKQITSQLQDNQLKVKEYNQSFEQCKNKLQVYEKNLFSQKKEQERLKQHLKIITAQYNKILESKQQQNNAIAQQASKYYLRSSQLSDALKFQSLRYEELLAEHSAISAKYKSMQKKYKDLRLFIKDEQTISYQDLHKLQEQNSLLRDNLARHAQRIELMKDEYIRKNKEVQDLKEELKKQKNWVTEFTRFKKKVLTSKRNSDENEIPETPEITRKSEQYIMEDSWQIGQTKIQLDSIIGKIEKLLSLNNMNDTAQEKYNFLQRVSQIQGKIQIFEEIKLENDKLKARNKYLTEKRNSDFIQTLAE